MADRNQSDIYQEFNNCVNMAPKELEEWLATDRSKSVGDTNTPGGDGGESTGHKMGRRIVELKRTAKADLEDADFDAMNKVVGYVHRHSAQRPDGDVSQTNWRYSLMNWGHDPCRK
ncbi:DUF3140 domain-containing protein [Porphyrobacter sp. GA68]|uniref:DUF3140 domain-containing protein n=1 Tax=Porphyrobacter sp. GA68 TaxID=2883480 RepID=UPI001D1963A4|nr:DUF3140 domain-containing protein [Porphyrobacter sp. GA68]